MIGEEPFSKGSIGCNFGRELGTKGKKVPWGSRKRISGGV